MVSWLSPKWGDDYQRLLCKNILRCIYCRYGWIQKRAGTSHELRTAQWETHGIYEWHDMASLSQKALFSHLSCELWPFHRQKSQEEARKFWKYGYDFEPWVYGSLIGSQHEKVPLRYRYFKSFSKITWTFIDPLLPNPHKSSSNHKQWEVLLPMDIQNQFATCNCYFFSLSAPFQGFHGEAALIAAA